MKRLYNMVFLCVVSLLFSAIYASFTFILTISPLFPEKVFCLYFTYLFLNILFIIIYKFYAKDIKTVVLSLVIVNNCICCAFIAADILDFFV